VPDPASPVYRSLEEHQRAEDWRYRALMAELHRWAEIFDREFTLQVPEVALAIDRLRRDRLGQFRYGHNGLGLRGHITIACHHLSSPFWNVLGTLLHELLHGWQQAHGRPGCRNYHNKQFRVKARQYGLIVDSRGYTEYEPESPFFRLLERYGVVVVELPAPTTLSERRGGSKLKKWSCRCTPPVNLRAAVEIDVTCNRCRQSFRRAD
jgi:hypothetical protein